ncbi:hypothetical protein K458DRAFT_464136 [Lentithecium fluviatile CBS 122367]|uniref:Uncharacterized protein n=1 Tax=Lentithecium fluviatile CBS 122367 TaxID=1168545 RepID=A0A6G1IIZ5_9PLEO|nr:hypothetical protein K458DRAFT_464136 [Lentithecium fluviatile CBS 122367]
MRFFPSSKKESISQLPTISSPKPSHETSKTTSTSTSEKPKPATSPTSPTKPLPARTPSTRFQEPVRAPSQSKRSASNIQRSVSTKSTASTSKKPPERPGLQRRRTTAQTRYIDMLLGLDAVSRWHNILASASTWILLAGYIVFPATFNKLQTDKDLDEKANSALKAHVLKTARNVPLLYVAAFACGIGVLGCLWLWWAHRKNYVWVINRIFLPALMNSIAGLISTLVNIYSAQDGQYSVTARATIVVTASCSVVTAALFLLYNTVMLALVKRKHEKETKAMERDLSYREAVEQEMRVGGRDTGVV